jgi:tetratricopeptide (TPR) repeat protein
VGQRYERLQLGKGPKALDSLIGDAAHRNEEFAILDMDDVVRFIEEADNLMALRRFPEAEKILWRCYVPQLAETRQAWHLGHTLAEKYAYCLQHLSERLGESQAIYAGLNIISDKPAEFYVNYSLALLRSGDSRSALDVCEKGLKHFPDDLDIIGNRTIALKNEGDVEGAKASALERLNLRRDVHSLEEAAGVLAELRDMARDTDLPKAVELAKIQFGLIREGLVLNPGYASLRLKEIQVFRFAHAESAALEACNAMINDEQVHANYRQIAMVELVEQLGSGKHFQTGLKMIEKALPNMSFPPAKRSIETVKWTIYADKLMIGRYNRDGERIVVPEVVEFFLRNENGYYPYPVMASRVLEWLARFDEAEDLLRKEAHRAWEARWRMAQMLLRLNRLDEANDWCEYLLQTSAWRAEAYDTLAEVAKAKKDTNLSAKFKSKGDEVFKQEMTMFGRLRDSMGIVG